MAGAAEERVLQFRSVQLQDSAEAFWSSLMRAPTDGDPFEKYRKAILRLERIEVPQEVRRTVTTPEQLEAAGAEAAKQSVLGFMRFVQTLRNCPLQAQVVVMIEMKYVGIKCEGRSGPYDLMYFPRTDEIYATDSDNDSVVYKLS